MEKNYPFLPEMVFVVVGIFLLLLPSMPHQSGSSTDETTPQQPQSGFSLPGDGTITAEPSEQAGAAVQLLPPTPENLNSAILIKRIDSGSAIRYACNGNLYATPAELAAALQSLKTGSDTLVHVRFDLQPQTPGDEAQTLFTLCGQLQIPVVIPQSMPLGQTE